MGGFSRAVCIGKPFQTGAAGRTTSGRAVFALGIAATLAACGGGGDAATPAPTPVSVTCPNGATSTAASLAEANAACPAPKLVSISPADDAADVDAETFAGIVVETDSLLDPASLVAANATLKQGETPLAGTLTANGAKGFKFVPTARLADAQAHTFSATVKDTLGRALSVSSRFTTKLGRCPAPQRWNSALSVCVYPVGVSVLIPFADRLMNCFDPKAACWREGVAQGKVRFFETGATEGASSRRLVFAAWTTQTAISFLTPYDFNVYTFDAETGEPSKFAASWGDAGNGRLFTGLGCGAKVEIPATDSTPKYVTYLIWRPEFNDWGTRELGNPACAGE